MPDKGRRYLLQNDFHHLYQCCNDKDKCNGLQIFQPESIEHEFLDKIGNNGSDGKHECNSRSHTRSCLNFLGYTEEWTNTKNCDNTMLFTNIAVININIYSIFLLFTGYAFFSLFTIAMR